MINLQTTAILMLLLFIFFFISSSSAAIDDFSVNCGSSGASAAGSGKEWRGDEPQNQSPSLQLQGGATVIRSSISGGANDYPVPYGNARLSRSQFSYSFNVTPGQKILRLHFNPASYRGFQRLIDLFDVEAGGFSLLGNFSASLTAHALGLRYFVKEFCVNIDADRLFDVMFSAASSQFLDTYAFINGIEIISVPASLSYRYVGVEVVGNSNVDNRTALEIIRRINLKQDSVLSDGDKNNMFGMWERVSRRKESTIKSVKWRTSVDVGFMYLVRLHFSELGLMMAEMCGVTFEIYINDVTVDASIGISREGDYEDTMPWYRDFMVMIKGLKREGKRDIIICLQSNDTFIDGHGLIEGFEIMKLSNSDNSLASPNPVPSTPDSSKWVIQSFGHVLGHKNTIATVVITVLALMNIFMHISRQIWEDIYREEQITPFIRAGRLCRRFSFAEIQNATRNFSDALLIGRGGFGKVYRGIIDDGQVTVAIKRLRSGSNQGQQEFLTEIETLTELRHVNLVSLIGYCCERGEMILVYEYMDSGTLADHLYKLSRKGNDCSSLTWKERLTICIGAGRGLDYLHTGHSLIHRDVKASNILLDENLVAKVADFGLARYMNRRSTLQSHISTKVKGTFGYLDPSYYTTGKLTRKSDTFSFGVVLLEVISGRPPVDPGVGEDEWLLTKWARENISKGKGNQIVALGLRDEISEDSLKAFLEVTGRCLHDEPKDRPTMAQVVLQLEYALKQQDSSKTMAQSMDTSDVNDIQSSNSDANSSVNAQQLTMAPRDEQNTPPPKEQTERIRLVNINPLPLSEREDRTKATTQRPARLRLWDAFWKRVKQPSGDYEDRDTETMQNYKQFIVGKALQPLLKRLKTAPNPADQTLNSNMQNFLQAHGRRTLELSLRRRDVEEWMSHRRLPEELRRQVREAERFKWDATRGVNEEMLMENLPEDLQRDIRRYLFKFVQKVRIFQLLDEPIIDAIYERLRTKTYIKESKILYRGGLVDKMTFMIRGKMESIEEDGTVRPLSEGDVCGEELLPWCLEHHSINSDGRRIRIPGYKLLSNRLVRCLTNVEAFVLRAADLEEVTSLFARFLRSPRVQGAIRYESPYWRGLAARRIQVEWRYRKKRQNRADSSSPRHDYIS